jgi:putative SOS response-associated peptidase YedK
MRARPLGPCSVVVGKSEIGYRLINARSDGVEKKPSFRAAFKQRRCLVVSSGFFEWERRKSRITALISV